MICYLALSLAGTAFSLSIYALIRISDLRNQMKNNDSESNKI